MNIKTTKKTKIKLLNQKCMPKYTKPKQAAMDCFANLNEPITLKPMERFAVPLGFCIDLDEDWEFDLRPRSGLAYKNGITLANCIGLGDEDYVDEYKAILINLGTEPITINPYDRVCQCQINHVARIDWEEVTEMRDKGVEHLGLGSTGISN